MTRAAAIAVAGGAIAAGGITYAATRTHEAERETRLQRAFVVAVSRAPGPQSETAVAVNPRQPRVLLAGSNDVHALRMRIYTSGDGGRRWTSRHLPMRGLRNVCSTSDPSVAIAPDGTQFYGFLGIHCRPRLRTTLHVYVATRPVGRQWTTTRVAPARAGPYTIGDDRPSIAVDTGGESRHRGRLYVGWTRFVFDPSSVWADPDEEDVSYVQARALVSHSDDGGRHWSQPAVVARTGMPLEVRLAVGRDGRVYALWRDAKTNSIFIAASSDGSAFGGGRLVAAATVRPERSCHSFRARIPAQPRRCVSPNPVVAVDTSRDGDGTVYAVWGSTSLNLSQDVYVAAFDDELRPRLGVGHVKQVNPTEGVRGPDQFLPTAAVDPATGRLWACYYQTVGRDRRRARFTCTASDDGGRRWLPPVAATTTLSNESRRPANIENGYGDYQSVAAVDGRAVAVWTDGRALRTHGEEIYAGVIGERRLPSSR